MKRFYYCEKIIRDSEDQLIKEKALKELKDANRVINKLSEYAVAVKIRNGEVEFTDNDQ